MMTFDPGLIRAIGLFLPVGIAGILWAARASEKRLQSAALLATIFNLPGLLILNVLAIHLGWWRYEARGGTLLGMPVDLWLGWALLWGIVPALAFPKLPLAAATAILVGIDLVYMPSMRPVLQLGPHWLWGEAMAVALCLLPAQLLARWTVRASRLACRAMLQAVCFAGLFLFVIPAAILERTSGSWNMPSPLWLNLLTLPVIVGLSAVQEFVVQGAGTPVPCDPPRRLVTTGVYAFVRNPMQMAQSAIFLALGLALGSFWVACASLIAVCFSAGLANSNEGADLSNRFGAAWREYAGEVANWLPRWRPFPDNRARIYLASTCGICSEIQSWLETQHPAGLEIVAAEQHPTRDLERITYTPFDGGPEEEGVAALGRALGHIHLGWAFLGWTVRLPLIQQFTQLIADASGGGPRLVIRRRQIS